MSTPETNPPSPWAAAQRLAIEALALRCTFGPSNAPVVCAVSGGADSMALLVLAAYEGLKVTAVHIDHGLRPGSDQEAAPVAALAERVGADFRSESVHLEDGSDLEARARRARRKVLGPAALTGHTADDQAETLLINLLRGAGVGGLSAMAAGPTKPILGLRRSETEGLCETLGLDPVRDPSNLDPRFVRNRVRHELLPLMADISQRDPVPLLGRTAERARAMTAALARLAEELDPTDTKALRAADPEVAAEALRQWLRDSNGHPPSQSELERVLAVVDHHVIATELAGGRRLSRSGGKLMLDSEKSR